MICNYNTSIVRAEWANPGPLLKQNGADTDVIVLMIDNGWDVEDKVGQDHVCRDHTGQR